MDQQKGRCGRILQTVREHPVSLLVVPLAVFCVLTAISVGITVQQANEAADAAQDAVQATADATANSIETVFQAALDPLVSLRSFIEDYAPNANHSVVIPYFAAASARFLASNAAITELQIAPYGWMAAANPMNSPQLNVTAAIARGGINLFGSTSYYPCAVSTLYQGEAVIDGPWALLTCAPGDVSCVSAKSDPNPLTNPTAAVYIRVPIFPASPLSPSVDEWSQSTKWPGVNLGAPLNGPFPAATCCGNATSGGPWLPTAPDAGTTPCTNFTSLVDPSLTVCDAGGAVGKPGRKFWGFGISAIGWPKFLETALPPSLTQDSKLRWSLAISIMAPQDIAGLGRVALANAGKLKPAGNNGGVLPTSAWKDGVVSSFTFLGSTMVVSVSPTDGFAPPWEAGVIAACVIASFLIALAVFEINRRNIAYSSLLYMMLPSRVVASMTRSNSLAYSETVDHATLLFVDIVGFTKIVSHATPSASMGLVNGVFAAFDEIVSKYGVTKVETVVREGGRGGRGSSHSSATRIHCLPPPPTG